jgi:hypothetical protein
MIVNFEMIGKAFGCNMQHQDMQKRASAGTHRALSGKYSVCGKGCCALCLGLAATRPSSGDLHKERFGLAAAPEDALPSLCIRHTTTHTEKAPSSLSIKCKH